MTGENIKKHIGDIEPTAKHIRVEFNGETIADSISARMMRVSPIELVYFFPQDDVRMDCLEETDHTTDDDIGTARYWTVNVKGRTAQHAAFTYPETGVQDHIAFNLAMIDAWYEEAERGFGHPRDPYHLVEARQSNRHVRVELEGVMVAETRRPLIVFETGLPPRYYLPKEDVRSELITLTERHTRCPYKGLASYYAGTVNGNTHQDIAWTYPNPEPEHPRLAGLFAFPGEKAEVYVDGERVPGMA